MSTKLTHEQAAFLRFVRNHDVAPIDTSFDWRPLSDAGFLNDRTELHNWLAFELTTDGEEALAEYAREWVSVRRADVEDVIRCSDSGDCGNMLVQVEMNFRAALEGKQ